MSGVEWSDVDLTDVVERAASARWAQQADVFGSWAAQSPATRHHVRESMLPTVVAVRDALADVVAAREAQAAARALREAADDLPAYTEGEGREGIRTWKQPAQDAYSIAIEEAQSAIRERADRIERGES